MRRELVAHGTWDANHRVWTSGNGRYRIRRQESVGTEGQRFGWAIEHNGSPVARAGSYLTARRAIAEGMIT